MIDQHKKVYPWPLKTKLSKTGQILVFIPNSKSDNVSRHFFSPHCEYGGCTEMHVIVIIDFIVLVTITTDNIIKWLAELLPWEHSTDQW